MFQGYEIGIRLTGHDARRAEPGRVQRRHDHKLRGDGHDYAAGDGTCQERVV